MNTPKKPPSWLETLYVINKHTGYLVWMLAWMINAVLLGSLLYIVLPQYDQTFNERNMLQRIEALTHSMNVDVTNVWRVDLMRNQRTYIGSHVLTDSDKPIVNKYISEAQKLTFTQTLPADVALSLMNGHTDCQDVFGVKTQNRFTQKFREEIKARQICWVPILSKQGNLIGYVAFLWKEQTSQEELASFMSRSIALVNKK